MNVPNGYDGAPFSGSPTTTPSTHLLNCENNMSADTAQQAENSAATATRLERVPVDNSASASGSGTNPSSSHLLPVNVTYLSEDGDQGAESPQVLMQSSTTSLEQLAEATTLRWEAKANRAAARQADEAEPEDIAARRKAAKQRLEASRFQHTAELTQAQIFLSMSLDSQCRCLARCTSQTRYPRTILATSTLDCERGYVF